MPPLKSIEIKRSQDEKPVIDIGQITERQPFFSVCVPTYNRANFLPQAIESVLAQDFSDFELIICDNASTDNTQDIVENYQDKRIRYIRYSKLVNMYANHNRCINLCKGEWIVFVHSDDCLINNQVINKVYRVLPELPHECILVTGKFHVHQSWKRCDLENSSHLSILTKEVSLTDILISNMGITPTGSFYKREYLTNNQFDEMGNNSDVFTADRTMTIITLLRDKKICVFDEDLIKRNYTVSASYQSSFDCNWHIGLSRSIKIVVNDPEWHTTELLLANNLGDYGKYSLDILIRLAYANEWKCFWRLIKAYPIYYLINWRIIHIFVIMLLGQKFYISLLTFYRQKLPFSKKYAGRHEIK